MSVPAPQGIPEEAQVLGKEDEDAAVLREGVGGGSVVGGVTELSGGVGVGGLLHAVSVGR